MHTKETKPFLVAFFNVTGHGPKSAATPLTGNGHADLESCWKLIRAQFPGVEIVRTGSTIEQRETGVRETGLVEYPRGATIQQLFDKTTDAGSSFTAGSCTFDGSECDVVLRFHHARNAMGVSLLIRATKTNVRFGGSISGQRLASELPKAVEALVGQEARDFKWKLVEV